MYPKSGWRLSNIREVEQGKNRGEKKARLYLSKIGFFTLVIHREFLVERVSQVCVKIYSSGRVYVVFLVAKAEARWERAPAGEPGKAVSVEVGVAHLTRVSNISPLFGARNAYTRLKGGADRFFQRRRTFNLLHLFHHVDALGFPVGFTKRVHVVYGVR